jgi:hypothetical protein
MSTADRWVFVIGYALPAFIVLVAWSFRGPR